MFQKSIGFNFFHISYFFFNSQFWINLDLKIQINFGFLILFGKNDDQNRILYILVL